MAMCQCQRSAGSAQGRCTNAQSLGQSQDFYANPLTITGPDADPMHEGTIAGSVTVPVHECTIAGPVTWPAHECTIERLKTKRTKGLESTNMACNN